MKTKIGLIITAMFAVFLQSCTENEPQQEKSEPVQFTFSMSAPESSGGRVAADDLPADAELVLTLKDNDGNVVFTDRHIAIMSLGGGYITEPLDIAPGRYSVEDFLIASGSEIIYAVPKKSTPLAPLVVRPLPYSFNVQKAKLTSVAMEVVSTKGFVPEDFGYVNFGIKVVNPLSIAVFTSKAGVTKIETAEAFLYDDAGNLIKTFNLAAKVNTISFNGDADGTYKLIVRKQGYAPYVRTFKYNDLLVELNKLPLKIYLLPAFTIKTADVSSYDMILQGSGNVDVDWGDGTVESFALGTNTYVEHNYAAKGYYYITITGDITGITEFYSYYGNGETSEINLDALTGLTSIRFGLTLSPPVVDLSNNTNLEFVNMAGLTKLEQLILPPTHKIRFILVDGPNGLDADDINYIINSIYTNAVANDIHTGIFGLSTNWAGESEPLIGPPSPEALNQLTELKVDYGWIISEF